MMAVLLLALTLVALTSPVLANGNLQFNATNVYFTTSQQNTLIVEGEFVNTGAEQINTVNPIVINVSVLTSDGWKTTRATFQNVQINLPPGGSNKWTFNLHNTNYINFTKWHVESDFWY